MINWLIAALLVVQAFAVPVMAAPNDVPHSETVIGHGGVPLVVQEWGNPKGPPVLLIHGFSFGAVSWKNQIGKIAREARIIAVDLRGHGLSGKPWDEASYDGSKIWADDIAAVLAAKGIKRPTIVGWSFGGYVAVDYLRHCGVDCASGLVLVSSLAGLVEAPPQPDPATSGMPENKGDVRADDYHALYEGIFWTARVMTAKLPSAHVELQKQLVLAMTPPYVRRAMKGKRLDNRDIAPRLNLPILIIRGGEDATIPEYTLTELEAILPDMQSTTYPGVGHSPFEEAATEFNSDLLAFVKRTSNAGTSGHKTP